MLAFLTVHKETVSTTFIEKTYIFSKSWKVGKNGRLSNIFAQIDLKLKGDERMQLSETSGKLYQVTLYIISCFFLFISEGFLSCNLSNSVNY